MLLKLRNGNAWGGSPYKNLFNEYYPSINDILCSLDDSNLFWSSIGALCPLASYILTPRPNHGYHLRRVESAGHFPLDRLTLPVARILYQSVRFREILSPGYPPTSLRRGRSISSCFVAVEDDWSNKCLVDDRFGVQSWYNFHP